MTSFDQFLTGMKTQPVMVEKKVELQNGISKVMSVCLSVCLMDTRLCDVDELKYWMHTDRAPTCLTTGLLLKYWRRKQIVLI